MSLRDKLWTINDATLVDASIAAAQYGLPRRIVPVTKYSSVVLADNPTVFYQFEELAGTVIYDSSQNAITGSLISGSLGLTGLEGSAMVGNGGAGPAARLIRTASLEPSISTPFSVEFWYYGTVYTTGVTTVLGANGQWWVFTNGGVLNLRVGGGGAYKDYQLNAIPGVAGQWNHFLVTYDGLQLTNSGKWYLNGNLTNQLTQDFGMSAYTYAAGAQVIADNQPAGTKIDNLAFYYNTVLPAASASTHFSGSSTAYYPTARWQTTLDTATTDVLQVTLPIYGLGITGSQNVMLSASNRTQATVLANEQLATGTYSVVTSGTTLYVSSALAVGQYIGGYKTTGSIFVPSGSGPSILYEDGITSPPLATGTVSRIYTFGLNSASLYGDAQLAAATASAGLPQRIQGGQPIFAEMMKDNPFSLYRFNENMLQTTNITTNGFILNWANKTLGLGAKSTSRVATPGIEGYCYTTNAADNVAVVGAGFGNPIYNVPYSYEMWINPSSLNIVSQYVNIMGSRAGLETDPGWQVRITPSGTIQFIISTTSGTNQIYVQAPTSSLKTGSWSNIIAAYTGNGSNTGMVLYINGVAVNNFGAGTLTSNPGAVNPGGIFGSGGGSQPMQSGSKCQLVALYSGTFLNSARALAHWSASLNPARARFSKSFSSDAVIRSVAVPGCSDTLFGTSSFTTVGSGTFRASGIRTFLSTDGGNTRTELTQSDNISYNVSAGQTVTVDVDLMFYNAVVPWIGGSSGSGPSIVYDDQVSFPSASLLSATGSDNFVTMSYSTSVTSSGAVLSGTVLSASNISSSSILLTLASSGGGGSGSVSYVYQSILVPAAAADGRAPKLEKLSRFQTNDDTVNRLQDQNVRVLNPLLSNPLVQGHILSNLPLKAGLNNIDHGLDRAPSGWTITNITSPATIIQATGSQNLASKFMILSSSAVCTASIYVF